MSDLAAAFISVKRKKHKEKSNISITKWYS